MDKLKDLKMLLEQQVNQITMKGDITPQDLEVLDKAVDVIKDIETICAMRKAEEEGGYSQAMAYGNDDMKYMRGNSYTGWYDPAYHDGRNYYTNGGTHTDGMSYATRDMGGNRRNYRKMYSREDAKDHMLDTIMRCMEKIEA